MLESSGISAISTTAKNSKLTLIHTKIIIIKKNTLSPDFYQNLCSVANTFYLKLSKQARRQNSRERQQIAQLFLLQTLSSAE